MDGSVIERAFTPAHRENREITHRDYDIVESALKRRTDTGDVREHLRDLGYV
jgi:hypothetical protein